MPFKIRKLCAPAALLACPLFLSACLPEMNLFGRAYEFPALSVTQMTAPASAPVADPAFPPLHCKIGRGTALFGRNWYDFTDSQFALHKGEKLNIKISRVRSTEEMTVQAFFDASGQKLIFCPFIEAGADERISCTSLYAVEEDLQDGIKRTFDIPSAVRGGAITCAYAQGELRSLATPPAGGN